MTDRQENKLSMYLTVKQVCLEHEELWEIYGGFVEMFNEFCEKLDFLQKRTRAQGINITGTWQDKKNLKNSLMDKAIQISSVVYAFAIKNGDTELADRVKISRWRMNRLRDTTLPTYCSQLLEAAQNNISLLNDYGISGADLSEFENEILKYEAKIPETRERIISKKTATSDIKSTIDEIDVILKFRMDKVMIRFKTEDDSFYGRYRSARVVVDL